MIKIAKKVTRVVTIKAWIINKLKAVILGDIPTRLAQIDNIQREHSKSIEHFNSKFGRIENVNRDIKQIIDTHDGQLKAVNSRIDIQETSIFLKSLLSAETMINDLYLESVLSSPVFRNKGFCPEPFSIGFSCNMANNHYLFAHAFNARGYKAKLVYQGEFQDAPVFNHPAWEELDEEFISMPDESVLNNRIPLSEIVEPAKWDQEVCLYSPGMLNEQPLKKFLQEKKISCSNLKQMLLLNKILPHWNLVVKMRNFDLLQVSGLAIALAPFTGLPYVTFPYGADIFDMALEDSTMGRLMRLGFKMASGHILSGARFGTLAKELQMDNITYLPFMCNTEIYRPEDASEFRSELDKKYGKGIFLLMPSRQDWEVKGNNKFFNALANLKIKNNIKVLCVSWGNDLERSRELIKSLGLSDIVFWLPLLTKVRLRKYINACDVVIDQFNIGEFGTAAVEAMACGKPVICYINDSFKDLCHNPPVLNCKDVSEIISVINMIKAKEYDLKVLGSNSLKWIRENVGIDALLPKYLDTYRKAVETGPAIWMNRNEAC